MEGGAPAAPRISKEAHERAAATKAELERMMAERKREMAERRARRADLARRTADMAPQERARATEEFEAREREARKRWGPAAFEPLVIVGRGA